MNPVKGEPMAVWKKKDKGRLSFLAENFTVNSSFTLYYVLQWMFEHYYFPGIENK